MYTLREANGNIVDCEPECWRCGRKLAVKCGRPWVMKCLRCKAMNQNPKEEDDILTPAGAGVKMSANESNSTG